MTSGIPNNPFGSGQQPGPYTDPGPQSNTNQDNPNPYTGTDPYGQFNQQNPNQSGQPAPNQPAGSRFFNWIRSLGFRRSTDRWIGGVSGAIANRLGWDPLIIRIIWFAFFCAAGFGALLYGLAWFLLPDERDGTIIAEEALVNGRFPAPFWMSILFMIIGCPGSVFAVPFISIPLFIALIVAAILLYNRDRNGGDRQPNQNPTATGEPTMPNVNPNPANPANNFAGPAPQQPFAPQQPGPAPYFGPARPQPAQPTVVYRRKPAGPVVVGIVSGLILLSLAGLIALMAFGRHYELPTAVTMVSVWILVVTFLLGLVTIIVGFTGRKSGGLIPLTIVALIASMCAYVALPGASYMTGSAYGTEVTFADRTYRSADLDMLQTTGLDVAFSSVTLDLSDWGNVYPGSACPTGELGLDIAFSDLEIELPDGCKVVSNVDNTFSSTINNDGALTTLDSAGSSSVLVLTGDSVFSNISVDLSHSGFHGRGYDD
ncbi:PspC domain-containing protein [Bifidobacterium callimiconis]|uniref:PspC domain-containing protein n=1 Tax=Bifidobacterium callimiconis TaxID=2306973 RepID=A0A430FBU2_9BIFI|nr:PspC domain-containing protein [Bifidobacterium callimiconis]RSX50315.1 PspC domain-containing protein [Bifidobacterium callimiconis]